MTLLCYRRHRFPPEIIQHAIWLYLRFTLSYHDVEQLLADPEYYTVSRIQTEGNIPKRVGHPIRC